MNLDGPQRTSLGVAIIAIAYFVGHTVHKLNNPPKPITPQAAQETAKQNVPELPIPSGDGTNNVPPKHEPKPVPVDRTLDPLSRHSSNPSPESKSTTESPRERPLLFRESIRLVDDEGRVEVVFWNSSSQPAIDVTTQIQWAIGDLNFDVTIFEPSLAVPQSIGNVAPNGRLATHASTGKKEDPATFDQIKKGTKVAYIFVQVTYQDISGHSYQPRFCSTWLPETNAFRECPRGKFVSGQKP